MNNWVNEQYMQPNMMMGMGHHGPTMPHQMQPQLPPPMLPQMQPPLPQMQPPLPQMQPPPAPVHHLMPPPFMIPERGMTINPAPPVNPPLIGPVQPDNMTSIDMAMSDEENDAKGDGKEKKDKEGDNKNREKERDGRRDFRENRDRDRGRSGPTRSRERNDRNDRNTDRNDRHMDRNDRSDRNHDRNRRGRRSKWDNSEMSAQSDATPGFGGPGMRSGGPTVGFGGMAPIGSGGASVGPGGPGMGLGGPGMDSGAPSMSGGPGGSNLGTAAPGMGSGGGPSMGSGQMMPGMMQHGQYGMQSMQNMGNMPNMTPNMRNVPNITPNMGNMPNMMPGMNMMMGNMMDQNMMMMNQTMIMPNQPIYVTDAVLLPPLPDTNMPSRREKPLGCRTIFVGGIPRGVTDETIKEIFEKSGPITDVKVHRQGVCHIRFDRAETVEQSFFISGYRLKTPDQMENEATTLFVDYALNRDDQNEYEKKKRLRLKTPPRIEPFLPSTLRVIIEKIKNDEHFAEAAPTLLGWLEQGECNKRNANQFYSLIQASNNQVRRLFNEKMSLDEEYNTTKQTFKEKYAKIVDLFEQVAKILTVAKRQRVSDHFTKQQRRNIEMWLKMTEEVENFKEEFNANFDEEEQPVGRNVVPAEKYELLRVENENLMHELEGYKNEAHLAKDEAERKFEKFKAHYIAQQALQNKQQQPFPPLPPTPTSNLMVVPPMHPPKPQPPPPTPDDDKVITSGPIVAPTEAKLISVLTAFLMVHPLGASLDYLVSYVRSMVPNVTQATVQQTLLKYNDVFDRKTTGIGANIEHRWSFATFDIIKSEGGR